MNITNNKKEKKEKNQNLIEKVETAFNKISDFMNRINSKRKINYLELGKKFRGLAKFLYQNILNDPIYISKYSKLKKDLTLIEFSYWAAGFIIVFPFYFLIFFQLIWWLLVFLVGFNFIVAFALAITFIPLSLILGFAIALVIIYIYPDYKLYKRKKSLDYNSILATIYMELLYTAGMPPTHIFKILSKFPEFKEVWIESKYINSLLNLGVDLPTALEKASETCPDSLWKKLIDGMREMIVSGGDLRTYFLQKREEMIDNFRARYKAYTDFLGIITEVYINLVIVGTIFMTIIIFVAAMLNVFPPVLATFLLKSLIYFVIPFFSFLITLIIKEANPFSD